MFNIDELIQKWDSIGLLGTLPNRLKPNVALKYELIAMYIIDNEELIDNVMLTNCIFPIAYRIYNNERTIGDIKDFVNQVNNFFIYNRELIQDLNVYPNVDVEMEISSIFVERYYPPVKDIKPMKYINKHRL